MSDYDDRYTSAAEANRARATAFYSAFRKTCRCRDLELRQESGQLLCACGAVLAPREVAA